MLKIKLGPPVFAEFLVIENELVEAFVPSSWTCAVTAPGDLGEDVPISKRPEASTLSLSEPAVSTAAILAAGNEKKVSVSPE